ncbi:MAG: hypothetical protein IJS90_02565 [Clostridia bacterium]|nr:hypothetical protein [Clostridia bacterium]
MADKKINIIHGTDWWTDCDDITALRVLCRAHKAEKINLLCVGINSVMEYSAPSVSAFTENEGVKIPIGIDRSAVRDGKACKYQKLLASYPHSVRSNDDCPDAWKLYRKTLAQLDGKADITEVGFPQIIMQLMKSGPDEYSPLTGLELIKEKVNRIWLMAGRWDREPGNEYNFAAYPECSEAGHYICENSPVPLVFLGFEIGWGVITGGKLKDGDMMKEAFIAHGSPEGRHSWDPMLVTAAITQNFEKAGYSAVYGKAKVDPETGDNYFTPGEGNHCYLVKTEENAFYEKMINEIIASKE